MRLGREELEAALLGGAVLGGGGGGSLADGRVLGEAALAGGVPTLVALDTLPADALVATVALVGAPAAPARCVAPAIARMRTHGDVLPGDGLGHLQHQENTC